jgi:Bacterial virulence factor lipase N-terminal
MKARVAGLVVISVALGLTSPLAVAAAPSVHAHFDLNSLQGSPFPSNRFTVADSTQNTGLRVDLPKHNFDCAASAPPSDCSDFDVLNELDGFNLQPRLSIPFDGPIDARSVSSKNVFLVSLGSTLPGGAPGGEVVGIDQVVRDTFTNTLYVESDDHLDQHTSYVLVVTGSVLDANGKHVKAAKEFLDVVDNQDDGSTGDPVLDGYRLSLREALVQIDEAGIVPLDQVVAASVFTTQSATAIMEKIRDQIKAATPDPADFLLGLAGSRTVFGRTAIASIKFSRQTSADPSLPLAPPLTLPLSVLDAVPGAVDTIAFGRYSSPDYRVSGEYIPAVGIRSGTPLVRGTNDITFILFMPSSPQPADGYPVAIYGHGARGQQGLKRIGRGQVGRTGDRHDRDRWAWIRFRLTQHVLGHTHRLEFRDLSLRRPRHRSEPQRPDRRGRRFRYPPRGDAHGLRPSAPRFVGGVVRGAGSALLRVGAALGSAARPGDRADSGMGARRDQDV